MGILDGVVEWISEQIMHGLDLINTSVLGALGCGIGGMIFPVLMGTVCDIFSISMSFFFLAFLALGGFFLCYFAK